VEMLFRKNKIVVDIALNGIKMA